MNALPSERPLIPVAATLRMSTDEQETSISIQRETLLSWCPKEGYEIVAWYIDEGLSGSMDLHKRVNFLRMLEEAPKAAWQRVVCTDLSRFGRLDSFEGGYAANQLRKANKLLHCKIEGLYDFNKSKDRLNFAHDQEAQHDYAIKVALKTLEGKVNAFHKGKHLGKVPYGFARRVTDPFGNVQVIPRTTLFRVPKNWHCELVFGDADEVATVLWVFETFAYRDIGFRHIAALLNRQGKPAPEGGKWCDMIIQNMLTKVAYVGDSKLGGRPAGKHFRFNGEEVVRNIGTIDVKPAIKRDTHKGIVSRELWAVVQTKYLRRKETNSKPQKDGGYALSGVLFCGVCGKPLYGNPNRGKKKSGKVTYVCKTAVKYAKECSCSQWAVKEEEVLPFLQAKLIENIDKKLVQQAAAKPPEPPKPTDISKLEKQLAKLNKDIQQGTENLLRLPVEMTADLQATLLIWKAEKDNLQHEIERAQQTANPSHLDRFFQVQNWFRDMRAKLVEVDYIRSSSGKPLVTMFLTADALRELLKSNKCRLYLWFQKNPANRWEVCKGRLLFGDKDVSTNAAPCSSDRSLMVWCGVRNGRRFISGSSAGSRPIAE